MTKTQSCTCDVEAERIFKCLSLQIISLPPVSFPSLFWIGRLCTHLFPVSATTTSTLGKLQPQFGNHAKSCLLSSQVGRGSEIQNIALRKSGLSRIQTLVCLTPLDSHRDSAICIRGFSFVGGFGKHVGFFWIERFCNAQNKECLFYCLHRHSWGRSESLGWFAAKLNARLAVKPERILVHPCWVGPLLRRDERSIYDC